MTLQNRKNHSATDESVAGPLTIALGAPELVRLCSHGGRIGLTRSSPGLNPQTDNNQRT